MTPEKTKAAMRLLNEIEYIQRTIDNADADFTVLKNCAQSRNDWTGRPISVPLMTDEQLAVAKANYLTRLNYKKRLLEKELERL